MKLDFSTTLASLLLILGAVVLNYFTSQSNVLFNFIGYSSMFVGYIFILRKTNNNLKYLLGLAIFLRFLSLFSIPKLSDDVFRFIWDGNLIYHHFNPFLYLPTDVMKDLDFLCFNEDLFQNLNSPNYYTIYPPVHQLINTIVTFLFHENEFYKIFVYKFILFLGEIGTLYFIWKTLILLKIKQNQILIYALNPLIIIELVGNTHFEGIMIFFLAAALYFLLLKQWIKSALFFGLSVATKLLPIMFLPLLFWRIGFWKTIKYGLIVASVLMIGFLPFFSQTFIENIQSSFELYFQKFEFNASVYYIFRAIGFQLKGYNFIAKIGPTMLILASIGLVLNFVKDYLAKWNIFTALTISYTIYLFFALTIHPWYLAMLPFFAVFTNFKYPVVWSYLIILTYFNYNYGNYQEQMWLIGMEYFTVIVFMIYDYKKNPQPLQTMIEDFNMEQS